MLARDTTPPAPSPACHLHWRIRLPDRTVTAEVAAKSLRKAQTAIREAGAGNIVVPVLQGHLVAGDVIAEAGLSAQPKAAKPAPQWDLPPGITHQVGDECPMTRGLEGAKGASRHLVSGREPRAYA